MSFGWRLKIKCIQGAFCVIYLLFWLYKRMYSHPSGRSARLWLEGPEFEPQWCLFGFFHIFAHSDFFGQAPGPPLGLFCFFLTVNPPCRLSTPLVHFIFLFSYFYLFVFLNIFLILKNHKKYKNIRFIFWHSLFINLHKKLFYLIILYLCH